MTISSLAKFIVGVNRMVRMAYGFRNIDNLIALIYLRCGGRVIYAFLGILEILKLCCHPLFGLRIYR